MPLVNRAGSLALRLQAKVYLFFFILFLFGVTSAHAAALPEGFAETQIATGMTSVTRMAISPDNRIFICEQSGNLRLIRDGVLQPTPFLTVSADTLGEHGLVGITFDPDFLNNHYLYIYYTATSPTVHNRVSRFTAGDTAVEGSETIIFELDDSVGPLGWHQGGDLHFAADGKLFVSVGDDRSGSNSQSLSSLFGKILRINSDGTIPADNPFYSQTTGKYRAIWAFGLRNPFSYSLQPGTSRMFINDVGEDSWEEINDGIAASNYGWPETEGYTSDPQFRSPLLAYAHGSNSDSLGCAITGGSFYNPATQQFPETYRGKYFYADFCEGWIRMFDPVANTSDVFARFTHSPVDMEVTDDGSLYYLERGNNPDSEGAVYKIQYTNSTAPSISVQPADRLVSVGQPATFTVAASGQAPLSYQWQRDGADIPDATDSTYTLPSAQLSDNGATFRCVVSNSIGSVTSNSATLTVTSDQPPIGTITMPASGTQYRAGDTINYAGTATDPEDGTLPASAFTWQVDFHHNTHIHPFIPPTTGAMTGSFTIPDTGETSTNVWYRIILKVQDSGGLLHTSFVDITPIVESITIDTNPSGLQIKLDDQPHTTPLIVSNVAGMNRLIEAPSPQTFNGDTYDFVSWSDGGAASHSVNSAGTFIATYQLHNPTAVKVEKFEQLPQENGVLLEWQTGREVNNLGFNLYREEAGQRVKLNSQLIAGSAFRAGEGITVKSGNTFSWFDNRKQTAKTCYRLESVDLNGESSWYRATLNRQTETAMKQVETAAMLSAVGSEQAPEPLSVPQRSAPLLRVAEAQAEASTNLAAQKAVKIAVRREGYYRISQPELVAAGLDANVKAQKLQLYADGKEIPMSVVAGKGNQFDSTSAIEFYAVGLNSQASDKRIYWLVVGAQSGKRIEKLKLETAQLSSSGFSYTLERRDHTLYFAALKNGEAENFFGSVVTRQPVDQTLTLQHLDIKATEPTAVEIALQGVTQAKHQVQVSVNGTDAGEVQFTGQDEGVAKLFFSQALLREGANQITLTASGTDSDVSLVKSIRLTYQHTFTADNDALQLTPQSRQQITVGGFSNNQIRAFDVTEADDVKEIPVQITGQKNSYAASFVGDEKRTIFVTTTAQMKKVDSLTTNQLSNLHDTAHAADLLIISPRALFDSAERLQSYRQSQGLAVSVIDIEDIYDEFSFGNKSPLAIRDFLAYTKSLWAKAPRYVLLMGDATYDPKNYLGLGDNDLLPTKLIDTKYLETASDDWFADFDEDGVAEMAVGRLPVRTSQEAAAVVEKIIAYERQTNANGVLLVADSTDDYNFEALTEKLKDTIPSGMKIEQLNRGQLDETAAKAKLLAALQEGQRIVNYTGHGSVNNWRGNLLTSDEARQLENSNHLPLFIMMDCLNGYFQDVASSSLAEELVKAERGGAVAVWASSGLTTPDEQAILNQQLFQLLFENERTGSQPLTLGEMVRRAKTTTKDNDVRRTWILFGDPSMQIR
jgi:glucose/arabinose dehydrogenase